jgi:hypothetical protein
MRERRGIAALDGLLNRVDPGTRPLAGSAPGASCPSTRLEASTGMRDVARTTLRCISNIALTGSAP